MDKALFRDKTTNQNVGRLLIISIVRQNKNRPDFLAGKVKHDFLYKASYFQRPPYQQPQHLQISGLRKVLSLVEDTWQAELCDCHSNICLKCNGDGCYSCFQLGCVHCDGTGWKRFSKWKQGGFKIIYDTRFAIAEM